MPPEQTISEYLGALCEVLTPDNQLLFVGLVRAYYRDMNELEIHIHRGARAPGGLCYNDPIKLRVHTARGAGSVVMLYSAMRRCTEGFWRVEIQNSIRCLERRESFRQPVAASGTIWRLPAVIGESAFPCQLTDISLTGVGLLTQAKLYEGDRFLLRDVVLEKEPAYTFQCSIRRVHKREEQYLYGCSFYGLSQQQEERLCQTLFSLQARALNRSRQKKR